MPRVCLEFASGGPGEARGERNPSVGAGGEELRQILLKMFDLTGKDDFNDTFQNSNSLKKLKLGDYILLTNVKYHPRHEQKKWSESISLSYLPDQKKGRCGFAVPSSQSGGGEGER